MTRVGLLSLGGAALLLCPLAAQAQSLYDRTDNVPVTARSHSAYDALGERLGDFTVFPRLSVSGTYDDNIFGVPQKTSGGIITITPSVDFVSNWNRNALNVELRYERDQYADQPSESSNEVSLNSTGRLDLDRSSAITGSFNIGRFTEPRTDPDSVQGLIDPIRYDGITAIIGGYKEFGRLRFDATFTDNYYSFFNGTLIGGGVYDESSRDENALSERFRLSWALDPNIATFVELTPNQSTFLHTPFNGLASYDSTGYQILGGVNAQVTHLITADVGVGYLSQHYDDQRLADVSGIAFNADIHYFPTPLITVTANGNHSIQASGIPGTPASNVDAVNIKADYELFRNVLISPSLGYTEYRYPGTSREDDRYNAGLNATYLVNRGIGITASYAYLQQASTGGFGGFNFSDNRLTLTLTLQR